jgi:protein-S-isoprenylcysteine O-methyltransferase Ste14
VSPALAIYLIWGLWLLVWIVVWYAAALAGKREPGTLRGFASAAFHLVALVAYTFLLLLISPFPGTDLQHRLWQFDVPEVIGWLLLTGVTVGFVVFVWASVHRFRALKHGASVVDGGPYAVVRHPIYLAAMLAAVMTAFLFGQPTSFIGAALLVVAMVTKVVIEEHAADDTAHDDYRRRVPMFVPFWPKAR